MRTKSGKVECLFQKQQTISETNIEVSLTKHSNSLSKTQTKPWKYLSLKRADKARVRSEDEQF